MSTRLQVVIDDEELDEIRRVASRQGLPVSEWVRQTLRQARRTTSIGSVDALVTDVKVLQEVLHRYAALRRIDAVQPAFDITLSLVDEVLPVRPSHVRHAKDILLGEYGLSARDTLHLAVMADAEVTWIMSFDTGFDSYPGIERLT
jgi:hypothetical protein